MTSNRFPIWTLALAAAYVAVAVLNREFAWAWGREWLAPTMMLAVLSAILFEGVRSCSPAKPSAAGTGDSVN